MKSGQGDGDVSQFLKSADDVFRPVAESAIVLAAHYASKCGRRDITKEDFVLGLKHAARNVTGRQLGTLYPEIYEDEEEDEEDDEEEDEEEADKEEEEEAEEEEEEPASKRARADSPEQVSDEQAFTLYEGDDPTCLAMNACNASWADWVPESPAEILMKAAVAASAAA